MVAMREEFNRVASKTRSNNERTPAMDKEDKIAAVLKKCISVVTRSLIQAADKEQENLLLMSDEARRLVMLTAVFHVVKVLNFDNANRKGNMNSALRTIRAYEDFANRKIGPAFDRMCNDLQSWRDGTEQKS